MKVDIFMLVQEFFEQETTDTPEHIENVDMEDDNKEPKVCVAFEHLIIFFRARLFKSLVKVPLHLLGESSRVLNSYEQVRNYGCGSLVPGTPLPSITWRKS